LLRSPQWFQRTTGRPNDSDVIFENLISFANSLFDHRYHLVFAVARYDCLDRDSRFADQNDLTRQSAGLTYRPIPAVSLKVEVDRYEPQGERIPAYYGVTTAAVWFSHLP
jgi:hypothetical protein